MVEPRLTDVHPSTVDICDNIMDISKCPDRISIDFNTFKTSQHQEACFGDVFLAILGKSRSGKE